MIAKRFVLAATIVAALPLAARAQTPPPPPPARHVAPAAPTPQHGRMVPPVMEPGHAMPGAAGQHAIPSFDHLLFPPELVMQHQRALELTVEQRSVITNAVKSLQNQTVDLQWNLQAEQSALTEMLNQRPINEQGVVAQVSKLLELEANVKRTHLSALVRIKNALTEKQIQQLTQLRGGRYQLQYDRDQEFEYFPRDYNYVDRSFEYFDRAPKHFELDRSRQF